MDKSICWMTNVTKKWMMGALYGWPRLSEYNECGGFVCVCVRACMSRAWVCVLYHCKPFCWCFLLLILSLGSCYIKLLSGLLVWRGKKLSQVLLCTCTLPTVQGHWVCVGRGWEETEWRSEAQIQKHKYLQREWKRQRGGRRQAAWRKEYCVMLSTESKITLERQEHKGSTTNSAAQQ